VTMPDSTAVTRSLRRTVAVTRRGVAWGVAARVAVLLLIAGVVLGAFPFTLGVVGGEPIDTGDRPGERTVEEPQQRFQNSVATDVLHGSPWVLLFVALAAAFAAGNRPSARRHRTVSGASVGVAAGVTAGYVALVVLAHLALAPTPNGFIVDGASVTLQPWATVTNALALAVPVAIGAGLTATVAALSRETPRSDEPDDHDDAAARPEPTGDGGTNDADGPGDRTDERGDGDGRGETVGDEGPAAGTAGGEVVSGPAGAPAYDPDDRDWEGTGEDDG